jgi:hypothetical protein
VTIPVSKDLSLGPAREIIQTKKFTENMQLKRVLKKRMKKDGDCAGQFSNLSHYRWKMSDIIDRDMVRETMKKNEKSRTKLVKMIQEI